MAIVILFTILSNFEVAYFDPLKPFLFTTYIGKWRSFFEFTPNTSGIYNSGIILILHILALYMLSIIVFSKKDITT
jgi:ABC-type transport system involved in multi-copper enzyme maturation permease subunit